MYLNVSGGGAPNASEACTTPEIISTLVTMTTPPVMEYELPSPPLSSCAMSSHITELLTADTMSQSPLDSYTPFPDDQSHCLQMSETWHTPAYSYHHPMSSQPLHHPDSLPSCMMQGSSPAQSPTSPLTGQLTPAPTPSPPGGHLGCNSGMLLEQCSPPGIQAMRSQLIKEGLRLTIQSKRIASGKEIPVTDTKEVYIKQEELTPEDEERRKRRRERNKVAATKCRNKKKEKTVHLMVESESLEHTNLTLRSEIQRLESEKQRLLEMLSQHLPACTLQQINSSLTPDILNGFSSSIAELDFSSLATSYYPSDLACSL